MRYLDVCAGISASTVAWRPLGWQAAAYSEIEAAPRAVLAHHYPDTPLHGDFTTIQGDEYGPIDLLVGGTPCQDFSVAGLRAGLDGDRGNLSLEFLRLADRTRPRWVVWENVPGVLSIDGGRAFGAILGGLGELGYGFAYRILDAQFFGVPQRRRRVFVVGCLGNWRGAAAVLSERNSLSGNPAPRRQARAGIADCAPFGPTSSGRGAGRQANRRPAAQAFGGGANCHPTDVATAVSAHPGGRYDLEVEPFVTAALTHNGVGTCGADDNQAQAGHLVATTLRARDGGKGVDSDCTDTLIPVAFTSKDHGQDAGDMSPTLRAMQGQHANAGGQVAIAYGISADAVDRSGEGDGTAAQRDGLGIAVDVQPTLRCRGADSVGTASAVRRLTPRECERLQGFPDDYTLVPHRGKPMADGPRYKALGNSMAVPVMRWIGERIAAVDALMSERAAA